MTSPDRLERELPRLLEHLYLGPRPSYADHALRVAVRSPRHVGVRIARLWLSGPARPATSAASPRIPWRSMLVVGLLALGLILGTIIVAGGRRPVPPPTGPAGNGLIAYSHAGDIFVGDPVTGTSTAIVVGPEDDRGPIFSPDGTRIAFVRRNDQASQSGTPQSLVADTPLGGVFDIVIVQVDGAAARVITPAPEVGLELLGWSADGASVEATRLGPGDGDWLWQEVTYDASRATEPSVRRPGWEVPGASADIGRPSPQGDRVLVIGEATADHPAQQPLTVRDTDGGHEVVLLDRSRLAELVQPSREVAHDGPGPFVSDVSWSPDGTAIAFRVDVEYAVACGRSTPGLLQRTRPAPRCHESWWFLLDADGTDLRAAAPRPGRAADGAFVTDGAGAWSPDGSKLALDRRRTFESGATECCDTLIIDAATGIGRATDTGTSADVEIHSDVGHPGVDSWAWSPDGRSLLVYDYSHGRIATVDAETGTTTDLPWTGLAPSWQRVAAP